MATRPLAKKALIVLIWCLAIGGTLLIKRAYHQASLMVVRSDLYSQLGYEETRTWFQRGGDKLLMLFFAGTAVGLIAIGLGRSYRRNQQRRRDDAARALADQTAERYYEMLAQGHDVGQFVFYLRPFALDEGVYAPSFLPKSPFTPRFFIGAPPREFFEEYLARAIGAAKLPLISLGQPSGILGAGRIETLDTDWFIRFSTLAHAATSIALIPGSQPGIVSEVQYLRVSGLFWKTIFFKPVTYSKADWRRTKDALAEERIDLPDWARRMLSFTLYNSGRINQVQTWFTYPLLRFFWQPAETTQLTKLFTRTDD